MKGLTQLIAVRPLAGALSARATKDGTEHSPAPPKNYAPVPDFGETKPEEIKQQSGTNSLQTCMN